MWGETSIEREVRRMKAKALLLFMAVLVLILVGCEKKLVEPPVNNPYIVSLVATPSNVSNGGATSILCIAVDPDKNELTYTWSSSAGTFYTDTTFTEQSNVGNPIIWRAPETSGVYSIQVLVEDGKTGEANATVDVPVGDYKLLEVLGAGVFTEPAGVCVEASGQMWVADAGDNKVFHSPDGVTWSSFDFAGVDSVIDTTYIIDTTVVPHDTTVVIDTTADTLAFEAPMDVYVDGGLIYVLDSGVDKLHTFDAPSADGYVSEITSISGTSAYPPTGFVVVDSFAYAACGRVGVRRTNLNTGAKTAYASAGGARDIAFNGADRWWISIDLAQGIYYVREFDLSFSQVSTIEDSIYRPWGIAVAPSGNVFVTQWGNEADTLAVPQCHVAEFNSSGSFVGKWGDTGGGREEFNSPAGLWIASDNKIYVCDRGNGVVKVFGPN